jgi:hypothetical protein
MSDKSKKKDSKKEEHKVEPTSSETKIDLSYLNKLSEEKSIEEISLPYQIHIKNLTDEKIYNVDLFNYDHEKQRKLSYSCTNGVSYDKFLRWLSSLNEPKEKIALLRLQVWCDYHKFINKQINCCLHTIYEKPNGKMISVPLQVGNYFSANQMQSGIVDMPMSDNQDIQLFNELQLRFSYLMPETEMIITIYPSKINQ